MTIKRYRPRSQVLLHRLECERLHLRYIDDWLAHAVQDPASLTLEQRELLEEEREESRQLIFRLEDELWKKD